MEKKDLLSLTRKEFLERLDSVELIDLIKFFNCSINEDKFFFQDKRLKIQLNASFYFK